MKQFYSVLLTLVLLLCNSIAQSQCNFTITNLPDTLLVCKNSSVTLSPGLVSTGSAPTYVDTFWTPITGLSDPNIINPIVSVGTTNTNYILTVQGITPTNLISNGDFSQGNTIFSSSYIYGTGGTYGLLSNEAQYAIATNPQSTHVNFASFGDHTTGTGNMMVVNGASTPNVNIWCQTIIVVPNTYYDFSAWGASCVASNPAILQFAINGVLIGSPLALPLTTGVWTPFHATWFSGTNTSITICITDQATATSGNDFAIDDISFKQICNITDSVYVRVINLTPSILTVNYPGCAQDSVQFTADNGSGITPTTYTWDFGDGSFSSVKNPLHIYTTQGNYTVKLVTEKNGCKDSAYATINTLHPMNADFTIADTACTNVEIMAFDNSSATGPYTTLWDWKDALPGLANTHTYANPGNYDVTLTITDNLGCTATASHTLHVINPPYITLPVDITICQGEEITLRAVTNISMVTWQDGSFGFTYNVQNAGNYSATAVNFCGLSSDTIKVSTRDCSCMASTPNVFTPNGDHTNDVFKPLFYNCDVSNYELNIYNRWGTLLYQSSDMLQGWDGKYKGVEQELGTYFYYIQFYTSYKGLEYRKGDLILFR